MTNFVIKSIDGQDILHIFVYDLEKITNPKTSQTLDKTKHIVTLSLTKSGSYYKLQIREFDNNVIIVGDK